VKKGEKVNMARGVEGSSVTRNDVNTFYAHLGCVYTIANDDVAVSFKYKGEKGRKSRCGGRKRARRGEKRAKP
jgi:hypothetical protein